MPLLHTHAVVATTHSPSLPSLLLNVSPSPWHIPLINSDLSYRHTHTHTHTYALVVSLQKVTALCWVTAALSVCYRKIFCCQQFCKVTLDCHCERGKGHLFICLPPQTVNSFQWCLPSSIINCFWINDSLLFCTSGIVCHWLIHPAAILLLPVIRMSWKLRHSLTAG